MLTHYESMISSYDKRIEDVNSSHSAQLHGLMESHRKEMADYSALSMQQSKSTAQLQGRLATAESNLAALEIDKLQE